MTMDVGEVIETMDALNKALKEINMALRISECAPEAKVSVKTEQLKDISDLLNLFCEILEEKMHETKIEF